MILNPNASIAGIPILVSEHVQEFVPALKMRECGCSPNVLADFNAWLLERFGSHRNCLRVGGTIVMHPRTLHAIRQKIEQAGRAL